MKGTEVTKLRELANRLSQADLAKMLNVTSRTIAKWESEKERHIAPVYVSAIRTLLENLVLAPTLRKCAEKVFEKIPSEYIAIWLVRYSLLPIQYPSGEEIGVPFSATTFWEVILHENTARYQCFCADDEGARGKCFWKEFCKDGRRFFNDRIHRNMHTDSLTTYPLQSGVCMRLSGCSIATSNHKRVPGRINAFYHDRKCHSLLHVPYHIPDVTGPQPVMLLSLENKLNRNADNQFQVISFSDDETGEAFTQEDEQIAKEFVRETYKNDLEKIINAFDYLPSLA